MKYEIEIDGLPNGWEPEKLRIDYHEGDTCVAYLKLRRKVRKYDRSKTLDDVLTTIKGFPGYLPAAGNYDPSGIAYIWQPNIHGKCPVDPEACIVRVMLADGTITERLADKLVWGKGFLKSTIVSWQFVRLADNVEW